MIEADGRVISTVYYRRKSGYKACCSVQYEGEFGEELRFLLDWLNRLLLRRLIELWDFCIFNEQANEADLSILLTEKLDLLGL